MLGLYTLECSVSADVALLQGPTGLNTTGAHVWALLPAQHRKACDYSFIHVHASVSAVTQSPSLRHSM